MGVLLGVFLDRFRCTAVGVAFAQDRIDGAARNAAVGCLNFALFVSLWVFWVIWDGVALGLQLGDGGRELREWRRKCLEA